MDKYRNTTFDMVAIMAVAMGIETLPKDVRAGVLMIAVGGIICFLKYYFRKKKK